MGNLQKLHPGRRIKEVTPAPLFVAIESQQEEGLLAEPLSKHPTL